MPSPGLKTAKRPDTKDGDECVLLIEGDADVAAGILAELNSTTEERFHVEGVTELSSGIERLNKGGVGAVVLDLTLPDSCGIETFDKLFHAGFRVPILILSEADADEMARQAVQRGAQDYVVKTQAAGYRLRGIVRTMIDRRVAKAVVKVLVLQNEVANLTLDAIEEAVLRTNINGEVTYLNRMAEMLTGWCRGEALGRPVTDVLRITNGISTSTTGEALEILKGEDRTATPTANCLTCILVRRDGFELGIENTVTPIHDQNGVVTGSVVAFHDVSAARAKSVEMSRLAQHDSL